MGSQAHSLNPKGEACLLKHLNLLTPAKDEGPIRRACPLKHLGPFGASLGRRMKAQSARPKGRLWIIKKAHVLQIKPNPIDKGNRIISNNILSSKSN